ncbi:neuropeptides capa receptor-like [Anneissia japonica]|uniref:neuropeptides capa receptor-like n=1 Tax=Anneissia japonica TaxID=1529436 RepID=UPI001425BA3A|nr:neuropeptides capa receptor-like [Anneissia japonica]
MDVMAPPEEINITHENREDYVYSSADRILLTGIIPCVVCFGVISNIGVITMFLRLKSMRTVPNVYLLCLAIADLVYLLNAPLLFWIEYANSPIQGDSSSISLSFCKINTFIVDTAYAVSCLTIAMATLWCYIAICHPFFFMTFSRNKAMTHCILLWLAVATFNTSRIIYMQMYEYRLIWNEFDEFVNITSIKTFNYCHDCSFKTVFIIEQIIFLSVALILVIMYARVIIHIKNLTNRRNELVSCDVSNFMSAKRKLVRMVLITVSVYIFCIWPFRLLSLIIDAGAEVNIESSSIIVTTARVFMYLNSSVNPLIYSVTHEKYRRAMLMVIRCEIEVVHPLRRQSTRQTAV